MEFYISPKNNTFLNSEEKYSGAKFVILGIPLDLTSTFRMGTKEGPDAIRFASQNLESYDIFYDFDIEELKLCDLGDIDIVPRDLHKNFEKIYEVTREIAKDGKLLISLGGEHLISYPIIKVFENDLLIHFDAHADMRDDYIGEKWTHASVIKRIIDENKDIKVINLGLRATSEEEMQIIRNSSRFNYIDTYKIEKGPIDNITGEIKELLIESKKVHISFDLDILDPSACPGVGNPEPGGLSYLTIKRLLSSVLKLLKNKITSLDIVELNPLFDKVSSPFIAAKIIFDFLAILGKN
ncbi:MAG: agmatinase [Candidatus Lokiarchaeota archaeon]|nr:agmatinase [Candidatus Lokiarchaeota archaeon]